MNDKNLQRLLKLTPAVIAVLLVTILFVWLTLSIKDVLTPTILTVIIIILLIPFQKENRTIKILIGAILFLYLAWFISLILSTLVPFIIALILAFIFDPVVSFLEQKGMSRFRATILLMLFLFLSFIIILIVIIPTLIHETSNFIDQIPEIKAKLSEWISLLQHLEDNKVPPQLKWLKEILEYQIPPQLQGITDTILSKLKESVPQIAQKVSSFVSDIFSNMVMIIIGLLQLIIIPIVMFYMLSEAKEIKDFFTDLIPEGRKPFILSIISDINLALSNFLRGQITIALIMGTLTGIWLYIIGIKFALLIGVIATFCSLIPFLGALISNSITIVMVLFHPDPIKALILIIIGFTVMAFLESSIISPKILGGSLKLNPILIMLAIIVGGQLYSFWGMLLAIPAVCVLKVFFDRWYKNYKDEENNHSKEQSEEKPVQNQDSSADDTKNSDKETLKQDASADDIKNSDEETLPMDASADDTKNSDKETLKQDSLTDNTKNSDKETLKQDSLTDNTKNSSIEDK